MRSWLLGVALGSLLALQAAAQLPRVDYLWQEPATSCPGLVALGWPQIGGTFTVRCPPSLEGNTHGTSRSWKRRYLLFGSHRCKVSMWGPLGTTGVVGEGYLLIVPDTGWLLPFAESGSNWQFLSWDIPFSTALLGERLGLQVLSWEVDLDYQIEKTILGTALWLRIGTW